MNNNSFTQKSVQRLQKKENNFDNDLSDAYNDYIESNLYDLSDAWQSIGIRAEKNNKNNTLISKEYGKFINNRAKLSFYLHKTTKVWLLKDFDDNGKDYNPHSFAKKFQSYTGLKNDFYSEKLNLKSFAQFAKEQRENTPHHTTPKSNTKTTNTPQKSVTPQKNGKFEYYNNLPIPSNEEVTEYYKNRVGKELNLNLENEYFTLRLDKQKDNGIGINFLDLDKKPFLHDAKPYQRIRLSNPYTLFEGKKPKKYHSESKQKNLPYLTPIAYSPIPFEKDVRNNYVFAVEGEFKAFTATNKLLLPFIGQNGIGGLCEYTQWKESTFKDKDGIIRTEKVGILESRIFTKETKTAFAKLQKDNFNLVLDSDVLTSYTYVGREKQRANLIKKSIIGNLYAAKEYGFKTAKVSIVNPKQDYKGLDDLLNSVDCVEEIKANLLDFRTHNKHFIHFTFDLSKDLENQLFGFSNIMKASAILPKEPNEIIKIENGYLSEGSVFEVVKDRIQQSLTYSNFLFDAGTGLGKTTVFVKYAELLKDAEFRKELGLDLIIFVVPQNILVSQFSQNGKYLAFNSESYFYQMKRLNESIEFEKEHGQFFEERILFVNIDNYEKLVKDLDNRFRFLTVVDECHLLHKQAFRTKFEGFLKAIKEQNTIYLSATPINSAYFKNTHHVKFIKESEPTHKLPTVYQYSKPNQIHDTILDLVAKNEKENFIIRINSENELRALKISLNNHFNTILETENLDYCHLFLSDSKLNPTEKDEFEKIKKSNPFVWNCLKRIILTTCVSEVGFNILHTKSYINIFVNGGIGFDFEGYLQFIGRGRNFYEFEKDNIIITRKVTNAVPFPNLVLRPNLNEKIEIAEEFAKTRNKQYSIFKRDNGEIERKEFVRTRSESIENVYFNVENDCFEVAYLQCIKEENLELTKQNSFYFTNPKEIHLLDTVQSAETKELKNDIIKTITDASIQAYQDITKSTEKDKDLGLGIVLRSVWKETKDNRLRSKIETIHNNHFYKLEKDDTKNIDTIQNNRLFAAYERFTKFFVFAYKIAEYNALKVDLNTYINLVTCEFSIETTIGTETTKTVAKALQSNKDILKAYSNLKIFDIQMNVKKSISYQKEWNEYLRLLCLVASFKGKSKKEIVTICNVGRFGKARYNEKELFYILEYFFTISKPKKEVGKKKELGYIFERKDILNIGSDFQETTKDFGKYF